MAGQKKTRKTEFPGCRSNFTGLNEMESYKENYHESIYVSGNIVLFRRHCGDYRGVDFSNCSLIDRSSIGGFSMSSGRRMRKYLRETKADYKSLITLTYPEGFGIDGKRAKNDLKRFCQWLDGWAKENLNDYGYSRFGIFWFLEFTQSGRIHFHMLCTDFIDYRDIAFNWARIATKGTDQYEKHIKAGTRIEKIKSGRAGITSYIQKYAAKQYQKVVPEGFGWVGRFWGYRGYSERVSASTKLKTSDFQHFQVSELVKNLKNVIKNAISAKTCEKIDLDYDRQSEFIEIYAFKTQKQGENIEKIVNFIEFLRVYNMPEYENVQMNDEKLMFCYEQLISGHQDIDERVKEVCRSFA